MTSENNEVRCLGIRPAHNTDDFPVSQADKDLLKMTIHLMAYHLPTTTWKKVLCDVNGKLIIDPVSIRAVHSPISIPPPAFMPYYDTQDWFCQQLTLHNRASLLSQVFCAPVFFPPGVTVTKLTLFASRIDAAASIVLHLIKVSHVTTQFVMATCTANWIGGCWYISNDTISYPVIDNEDHGYTLVLVIDPNDSVLDVEFTGAKIEFTG